jgi:cysteine synthase A
MLVANILETIGETPVVRINRLGPANVAMYVKLEACNPSGSIKDRMALATILNAEKNGELKRGQIVVEATSGNTGIALAMVCAARGYPFVAFISDNFSIERRKIMRAYGARVVLTPAIEGAAGRIHAAKEYAKDSDAYFVNQYENPENPNCHRVFTAAEIIRDFNGKSLDWFVSGWGSGGTLTGIGEALKAHSMGSVRIVAAEPLEASVLQGKEWQPHKIQGWAPNFLPPVLNRTVPDLIISVSDEEARCTALDLAKYEGIFCGLSSGATFAAALRIAQNFAQPNDCILAMLPDTGERYLSTFLFDAIGEGSDEI